MNIQHNENGNKGAFLWMDGTTQAGEMTYVWAGESRFIIDHTEVDAAYAGQGVGKQLVEAAVEFARQKKVGILPLCPFAKKMFERHPELRDVLA